MKLFPLLAINSVFGAPSDEQTAKADEICKEVAGGTPKVFEYKFSGAQANLFECTYDVTENSVTSERKTLVKLYNNPKDINFHRANQNRLDDVLNAYQSSSDIGIGAKIYKTVKTGSGDNLNFAIVQEFLNGGDLEDGLASKADILEVAKLFAKNHRKSYTETNMNRDFCYAHWPWNTRAFGDHINDDFYTGGRKFIQQHMSEHGIGDMETLQEFYDYAVDQAEMAPSPVVFTHSDPHKGNIFKLDNGEYRLLDYDNSNIGPRIWDLIYFWNKLDNAQSDKDEWFNDFINAYVTEFNANGSPVTITSDQISNEFICHLPWQILQTAAFYNVFSEFEPGLKGIDALFLYGMDGILKFPGYPKCKKTTEPTDSFYGDCDGTQRSNDVTILNSSADAHNFGFALAFILLTVFNL